MTLEIAFRRFALLPVFIQNGNGEPRKAHWLGNKQTAPPQQDSQQGGHEDQPEKRPPAARRGYRDLASITLGDVDDAYNFFKNQLVSSPAEGWIARNAFCYIPLKRRGSERPPAVFGRVKTVFPADGYADNVEELELYFPTREGAPDVLHLHHYEMGTQRPVQSYCIGVKAYLSAEEMADFSRSENIFLEKGFAPIYEPGYLELVDAAQQQPAPRHWLYVIGSGWFASIPDSVQGEVREHLKGLARTDVTVLNYHPRRYSLHFRSLNEELDFQYGFSDEFLVSPQDTDQTLKKLEARFGELFMQGIG